MALWRDVRSAALKIQSCFRGWKETAGRSGAGSPRVIPQDTSFRFGLEAQRGGDASKQADAGGCGKRRVFARRHKVFLGCGRSEEGAFRLQCEELSRAMAYRPAAPAFREWRGAARRAVRQRHRGSTAAQRRHGAWRAFRAQVTTRRGPREGFGHPRTPWRPGPRGRGSTRGAWRRRLGKLRRGRR